MPYSRTYRLLSEQLDDAVLIGSPFVETSRDGITFRLVLLALTRSKFVVIARNKIRVKPNLYRNRLESQYSLNEVNLSVFKKTHKQVLKACFYGEMVKYFELGSFAKRKIFWHLWCNHVNELNSDRKLWPYRKITPIDFKYEDDAKSPALKIHSYTTASQLQQPSLRWTDKNIYLGSKREAEDSIRPLPVPGLGKPDDIKLLYLKPEYFGCWDQAEHWVQCTDNMLNTPRDSYVYTYTGEPTSNVTYTSIITTWK